MIDVLSINREELAATRDLMLGFPWEDHLSYAEWLAQTYYMVNHSTRLVALAGAHAPLDKNLLHARFVDHSQEERGHQLIAIADLKALGHTLDEFPCLTAPACMYQVQYYWIQFRGASSFFGYTLALESLALEFVPEIYRRVCSAHGEKTARFLKCHNEADVDHMKKAEEEISRLTQSERELAVENLRLSSNIYRQMLREIRAAAETKAIRKAA